ncbi:alpha-L-fucosidase [Verrucomicrobiota bacterium]
MTKQKSYSENRTIALFIICAIAVITNAAVSFGKTLPPEPVLPVPSKKQLDWQRMELTMFIHFGPNTFNDVQWGTGKEHPDDFHPKNLDCRQWTKVAKEIGFKLIVLTAKHHDGFCLWPSKHTEHSVKNSSWRNGKGDVMREFVDACKADGIKAGFYLSPWDMNAKTRATPAYADYFKAQLNELMQNYAPIHEVWFDGQNSTKVVGSKAPSPWAGFYQTIYSNNPNALIAVNGPDIRWVGNEGGFAREGESSVQDPKPRHHPGETNKVWHPAECDTPLSTWFYNSKKKHWIKNLDKLLDIYFKSVGRNSVLLLNVAPQPPDGLFGEANVARLREFRKALDEIFSVDFTQGAKVTASNVRGNDIAFDAGKVLDNNLDTYWATDDKVTSGWLEVELAEPRKINVINVQEAIFLGERVEKYHVEAMVDNKWVTVAEGTVIGQRNLLRTEPVTTDRLRLVIDKAKACPTICRFGAYFNPYQKPAKKKK